MKLYQIFIHYKYLFLSEENSMVPLFQGYNMQKTHKPTTVDTNISRQLNTSEDLLTPNSRFILLLPNTKLWHIMNCKLKTDFLKLTYKKGFWVYICKNIKNGQLVALKVAYAIQF